MATNDLNSPLFVAAIKAHQSLITNFRTIARDELLFRMSNARHLIDRAIRMAESSHEKPMADVFLGGTANKSTWRDDLKPLLDNLGLTYFDPVVPNWTPECQSREIEARETSPVCLYVITPKMTGVYSVAEVVDDSNKRPEKTVFCVLFEDGNLSFDDHQIKSLRSVMAMVERNGGKVVENLEAAAAACAASKHKQSKEGNDGSGNRP